MREIKFRAWDKIRKVWMDINSIDFTRKEIYLCGGIKGSLKNISVTQFTGLKDKNGKEIYEGDILSYGDKEDEIIIKIIWNDLYDNGYEVISQKDKNCLHDIRLYRCDEESEVIGNIYENPTLLED